MSASTSRPLTAGSPKVPHVEDLVCRPGFGTLPPINHTLTNAMHGNTVVTRCVFCGHDWATLDTIARSAA